MEIQESGEMYLETILLLKRKKSNIRSIDIVEELDYSKSSVSRAVNILKRNGFITIDNKGSIEFTDKGLQKAKTIYERHIVLSKYLIRLGVDKEIAEEDACRIEHVISDESFEAIKNHCKS